VLLQSLAY